MKKKIDPKIRQFIENGIHKRFRSLLFIVGDRARDQVVNLHYILSKITTKKPSVLWCYKKELGFSSHRKKRMKQLKRKMQRGQFDANIDDPFELFVTSTNIRYCYYKESQNILGKTFGFCVLQDFEALNPNILCRTIETVEGGGVVCVLLRTMSSLRQLYSLAMDSHANFRTENFQTVKPRFNERFLLSLADCEGCLVVDDELNILPVSLKTLNDTVARHISWKESGGELEEAGNQTGVLIGDGLSAFVSKNQEKLKEIQDSIVGVYPLGPLVNCAVTADQAHALMMLVDCMSNKSGLSAFALTAARGRGKSAALGLSIAAAIAQNCSNIFVTAMSADTLGTVFEFAIKGLKAIGMQEHSDFEVTYDLPGSSFTTTGRFESNSKTIQQITVHKKHRQVVKYINPYEDYSFASQAELLVIDEAAALPLPVVTRLLGAPITFISSTVNGYEGTGRSLSLKLISRLKSGQLSAEKFKSGAPLSPLHGYSVKEMELKEPIRYSSGDPVELWMNKLLCLDSTTPTPLDANMPLPAAADCELYCVDRDALLSYTTSSEKFLHNLVSLFVSSHYKNTPNDLFLLSDAPAHLIFVLLPHIDDMKSTLPDIYCAIQVCIEGNISENSIRGASGNPLKAPGDLIPWTLTQYFNHEAFGSFLGLRIVRIATHPALQRMGYGQAAMSKLLAFCERQQGPRNIDVTFSSDFSSSSESPEVMTTGAYNGNEFSKVKQKVLKMAGVSYKEHDKQIRPSSDKDELYTELIVPKDPIMPLLWPCSSSDEGEKSFALPVTLDYIGVSFGLTIELFKFWNRLGFKPVYLRSTRNEITGENSAIMLRDLKNQGYEISSKGASAMWLEQFVGDFRARFVHLLGSAFSHLHSILAISILSPPVSANSRERPYFDSEAGCYISLADIKKDTKSRKNIATLSGFPILTADSISQFFSAHDTERLRMFSQQLVEYGFVTDLLHQLCILIFSDRMPGLSLSFLQCGILLSLGLQRRKLDDVAEELNIPTNQLMALYHKATCKVVQYLQGLIEVQAEGSLGTGEESNQQGNNSAITPYAVQLQGNMMETSSKEGEDNCHDASHYSEMQNHAHDLKNAELKKLLSTGAMQKYSMEGLRKEDFSGVAAGGSISIKRRNKFKSERTTKKLKAKPC